MCLMNLNVALQHCLSTPDCMLAARHALLIVHCSKSRDMEETASHLQLSPSTTMISACHRLILMLIGTGACTHSLHGK